MAERTFHGTRLGLAAGGVYGHGAAEGGFLSPERLNAALETGRSTGFVGAAAPFAAEAVAPVMNFGANRFSSAARSTRNVNDALQSSGTNRGAVADAMARNPELMPLDVDPALFARAQGIATQPGPGRGIIEEAVNARSNRAGAAVGGAFDEALGSAPNVRVLLESIQQRVRAVGVQFDPLLAQAGSVDVRAIVAAIDRRLPNGWQYRSQTLTQIHKELASIRNQLVSPSGNPIADARQLHFIQSDIRVAIDDLVGANPSGADVRLANELRSVRRTIVDAIDESLGGPPIGIGGPTGLYRQILRTYADENSVRRAFDRSWQLFDNPRAGVRAYSARPEFWQKWADALSPDELEGARLGARARLDTEINSARNDAARGVAISEVGFNRERMAVLFDEGEVAGLTQQLDDISLMAKNRTALTGGSQTAQRTLGAEAVKVRQPGAIGIGPGTLAGGAAAASYYLPQVGPEAAIGLGTFARTPRRGPCGSRFGHSTEYPDGSISHWPRPCRCGCIQGG